MARAHLSSAIYKLSSEGSSIDDKMVALRFLKQHLGTGKEPNVVEDFGRSYSSSKAYSKGGKKGVNSGYGSSSNASSDNAVYPYPGSQEDAEANHYMDRTDGIETADNLSFYNRKRINQLVLNNVLKII